MLEMFKAKPGQRAKTQTAKAEDAAPATPSEPSGGAA
jgi:hypothetical protein